MEHFKEISMRLALFCLSVLILFPLSAQANEYVHKEVRQIADHAMKFSDGHDLNEYLFFFDKEAVIKTLIVQPEGSDEKDFIIEQKVAEKIDELKEISKKKWKAGFRTKYSNPTFKTVGEEVHIIFDAYYTMDNSQSPAIFVVAKNEQRSWRIVGHYSIKNVPK